MYMFEGVSKKVSGVRWAMGGWKVSTELGT